MTSTTIAAAGGKTRILHLLSPNAWLAVSILLLVPLLMVPLTLPLGAFYWDLFIYYDAANRILDGQVPGADFFAPVGPLGYYLFTLLVKIFPNAQPLLLVNWSLLVITAPLMALALGDVDKRSRAVAFSLLVPFLVFQILPTNVEHYSSYPGFDGFGIYNRQVCHLLYVLTAGLVFCRGQKLLLALVTVSVLALFLVKITGFAAAIMICAFAFAAGRLAFGTALAASAGFLASLLVLELTTGMTSAYVADILALVRMNEESLLPRFLQAASLHFGPFAAGSLLILALFAFTWPRLADSLRQLGSAPALSRLPDLLDRDVFWLAVVLFAGLFFETQNTGGQAFIFLWPVLLLILTKASRFGGGRLILVLGLVAATSLPTLVDVVQRAARAAVGQIRYEVLAGTELGPLGAVSQRAEVMQRADDMIAIYSRYPDVYDALADLEQLPSFTFYTDLDFQIAWLKTADMAVKEIREYEAANDVRFETIMSLNFVNPFPWLLDRHAPHHIAIGADPFRAVPKPDAETLAAVRGTDLVLYPKCPITVANKRLLEFYDEALVGHERISLSPCWDGFVRAALVADGPQP